MPSGAEIDKAVFDDLLKRDPASRVCFECGYDNAQWAIVTHGILVCLDCSGIFRSLGTHLCFTRHATMDGWSDWKPEKLELIKNGGNGKCRRFFDQHGVPPSVLAGKDKPGAVSLQEKFMHRAALMYVDKLQAEANGQKNFNEAAWQAPPWYDGEVARLREMKEEAANPGQKSKSQQQQRPNQYGGYGSAGSQSGGQQQRNNGNGTDDFLNFLGTAASKVTETTSYYAKEASSKTKQWYEEVEKNANTEEISQTAKKSADAVSEAATSAWGTLSSWTTTGFSAVSAFASQAGEVIKKELDGEETGTNKNSSNSNRNSNINQDGDDGLGGLTRNVGPSQTDYGHSEHSKAEVNFTPHASPQQQQQQQASFSSPTTATNYQQQSRQSPSNTNIISSPVSSSAARVTGGPKALVAAVPAKKTFKAPITASKNASAKKNSSDENLFVASSPSPSSSSSATTPPPNNKQDNVVETQQEQPEIKAHQEVSSSSSAEKKKSDNTAAAQGWDWDDEDDELK